MDNGRLLTLLIIFGPLSLVSVGGGTSVFAEMQRQAVDVHGWMSGREFADLFAISRAAPGPGSLIAALIGWKAAGLPGAIMAALALYVPSSVLLYVAGLWWQGGRHPRVRRAIELGLRPVAVGLVFAGALRVLQADGSGWLGIGTATATTGLMLRRANPYLVLAIAAAVYAALFAVRF